MEQAGLHVFSVCAPVKAYTKPYHQRRTHRKSRSGCFQCKQKRVRCDEGQPSCTRCAKRSLDCQYQSSPGTDRSSASPTHITLHEPVEQPSPQLTYEDDLVQELGLGDPSRTLTKSSVEDQLMRHYEMITEDGLIMGPEPRKYHEKVMRMAIDHPYLSHTLLSIAALHLTSSKVPHFNTYNLLHISHALTSFQTAISTPISLDDSDALILTALMLSIHYFATYEISCSPEESWVFSTDPNRLSWFSIQQGQSAILSQVRPNHCRSGFLSHYTVTSKDLRDRNRRLPQALFDLCDVKYPRGPRGVHPNPYHDIVHALALLMPLDAGMESMLKYMHFCARVHAPFVALVEKNEHRAMLILGYWFGLLCNAVGDLWWCRRRAWRDCYAICMFLDREGGEDIRGLLAFPAEACGYDISSTERAGVVFDLSQSPDMD